MAYKDLPRRTGADKILCNKAFNITKIATCGELLCGLALMVHQYFDKKCLVLTLQVVLLRNVIQTKK